MISLHLRERQGRQTQRRTIQVRDDVLIRDLIAALVTKRHDAAHNQHTLSRRRYQLVATMHGTPTVLPADRCLRDLHIPPDTQVWLVAETPQDSLAKPPRSSLQRRQRRITRRSFITTGSILASCSIAGFLSGTTTAFAQRTWQQFARMPIPQPPSQRLSTSLPMITATLQYQFSGHTATVRTIGWSPDGHMLASGADDTLLLLWMPDGAIQHRLPLPDAVRALAWSPTNTHIAAGSGTAVTFLNAQSGQVLAQPQEHQAPVTSIVWSASPGHPVVSGSLDTHAIVWETHHFSIQGIFRRHTASINALAVGPGASTTIASASEGGFIRVWHLDTLQEVHGFYQDTTMAMLAATFAPDGTRLAAGGQDGIVRIWKQSQTCQRMTTVGGEPHCADIPQRLQGHSAPVRAVVWSPDGRYLATGGDDAQVILWDSSTETPITTILQPAAVHALTWSPTTTQLAIASATTVQIWHLS